MSRMKFISLFLAILVLLGLVFSLFFDLLNPESSSEADQSSIYRQGNRVQTGQKLNDENNNLFWFVQITDLHISKFKDLQRGPDLIKFCETHLTVIKPELVITSGDLVDAKFPDFVSSTQFIEEWQQYKEVLNICEKYSTAKWLDIRGNHDTFDVADVESPKNFYKEYSKQGPSHPGSYSYTHTTEYGKYSFIGVDACPLPGPKRPFNFFGQLNADRLNDLTKLAEEKKDSNLTIWFGHYPTSVIVQDPPGIKHVIRNGIAYLCGHLHTLNGLVPSMYTRQKTGTLELELGDWRDNRMYRILAVDNDLLSFVDSHLSDWPVILITNPKNAQHLAPRHEPTDIIATSTHIRFLVFTVGKVTSTAVTIDGVNIGSPEHKDGPLFTLRWNPASYSTGLHLIQITVIDSLGNKKTVEQSFSLDGTTAKFRFWPRLILMVNVSVAGKMLFGGFVFLLTLFLTSLRQCTNIRRFFLEGEGKLCYLFNVWLYKLWLTARTNFTYYTTIAFILYVTFGPWFIGDLVEEHTGWVFVWGIFLKDTFLPASITYFYGMFQLLTFNIPLMFLVSHILDKRSRQRGNRTVDQSQSYAVIPFIILLVFQTYIAIKEFPSAYGTKALVMGPVRTGSVVYALFVYYFSHRVRVNDSRVDSSCTTYS